MSRGRPHIQQRKPIFIGCEGESEQGYAGFLQDLIRDAELHVHLNIEVLSGGDPQSRIEQAVKRLKRQRQTRTNFNDKFVFLDTDQLALNADRAHRARQIAEANGITIIWQEPCFEGILLRHFAGRSTHRPPTSQAIKAAIRQEWLEYEKPMSRAELAKKIDREAVIRAAKVEEELMQLLRCIGLVA